MEADATRWDERHRDRPMAGAAPPEALADADPTVADLIPSAGTGLDVACGTGAQTLWMAERGLTVVAVDVSPLAIDLVRRAARENGVMDRIDCRVVDLDDGLPADITEVDLIVCQRFRDPRLYDTLVDRLRPGGLAVVTVLSQTGAEDPGPFHAPSGELAAAFDRAECDLLRHVEADGQESVVFRRT